MENLESLNAIVDEFKFKGGSLEIFGLEILYEQGKNYEFIDFEPKDYSDEPPTIIFEDEESSFCSIFSEQDFRQTQTSQFTNEITIQHNFRDSNEAVILKLLSDKEILSSEFGDEHSSPLLLSERI